MAGFLVAFKRGMNSVDSQFGLQRTCLWAVGLYGWRIEDSECWSRGAAIYWRNYITTGNCYTYDGRREQVCASKVVSTIEMFSFCVLVVVFSRTLIVCTTGSD